MGLGYRRHIFSGFLFNFSICFSMIGLYLTDANSIVRAL